MSIFGFLRFLVVLYGLGLAVAVPGTAGHGQHHHKGCGQIRVRQEWRDMKGVDQRGYIQAVRCLQTLPAKNTTRNPKFTRFDEFVISHIAVADRVHGVGHFLPWHRLFGFIYETALRQECAYRGPLPFWDWTRDADGFQLIRQSPIFHPTTGFGGDGVEGTYAAPTDSDNSTWPFFASKGCVTDGPFSSLTLHIGPGKRYTDHCLTRGIQESLRPIFTSSAIASIWNQSDYDLLWNSLDGRPFKTDAKLHDGGHVTIGGDMTSFYSSPNDPLFYLHHAGLDRLWWKWQQVDIKNRLYQIGGRSTPIGPPGPPVTLDHPLEFAGFAPTVPVRQVMDVGSHPYCYAYP